MHVRRKDTVPMDLLDLPRSPIDVITGAICCCIQSLSLSIGPETEGRGSEGRFTGQGTGNELAELMAATQSRDRVFSRGTSD